MEEEKYYRIKVKDYDSITKEMIKAVDSMRNQDYSSSSFFLGKVYGAFMCMIEKEEK